MRTLSQVRQLSEYTHKRRVRRENPFALWCFVAAIFAVLVLSGILNH